VFEELLSLGQDTNDPANHHCCRSLIKSNNFAEIMANVAVDNENADFSVEMEAIS